MIEKIVDPIQGLFVQVLVFIVLTVLLIVMLRPKSADKAWSLAGIVFAGFMLVNAALLWVAFEAWSYFFYSLGFSMLYLGCMAILLPALIKGLKIQGSAESAMVFIFIIYHPVLLLIALFSKVAVCRIFITAYSLFFRCLIIKCYRPGFKRFRLY